MLILTIALILSVLLFGMAANVPSPQGLKTIGINISSAALLIVDASTAQRHKLGTRAIGDDNTQYIYGKFGGTVTAKNFLIIDLADASSPYAFIETAAVTSQGVAVAMASGIDGQFGWFCVRGKVTAANVTTGVAAGRPIVAGGTAGRAVDFAGTETVAPMAIVLVTAASNAADVYLLGLL